MARFLSFDVINEWTVLEDRMRFAHQDFDFDALDITTVLYKQPPIGVWLHTSTSLQATEMLEQFPQYPN
jgi:hypothetical protein